eukprot:Lithocolla_globosa_v1_NODE_4682_length_1388_cov_6.786947.p2 type:complete len:150 gc:universal NODE_4682_length_1388_cov_6.786947:806-357(-)
MHGVGELCKDTYRVGSYAAGDPDAPIDRRRRGKTMPAKPRKVTAGVKELQDCLKEVTGHSQFSELNIRQRRFAIANPARLFPPSIIPNFEFQICHLTAELTYLLTSLALKQPENLARFASAAFSWRVLRPLVPPVVKKSRLVDRILREL